MEGQMLDVRGCCELEFEICSKAFDQSCHKGVIIKILPRTPKNLGTIGYISSLTS